MSQQDLERVIEQYHHSLHSVIRGDSEPQKPLWSRGDDARLANPLGPPVRGWDQIEKIFDVAASQLRDGEVVGIERVSGYSTADLAYIVEIERARVKIGGADEIVPVALRVTTVFRREADGWRIVHRHADPVTGTKPITSIVQR